MRKPQSYNTRTYALERSVEVGVVLKHFYSRPTSPWVPMLLLIKETKISHTSAKLSPLQDRDMRNKSDNRNATYQSIDILRKTYNRGTAFERSVGQLMEWGLKPVLLTRNLTLNSDAALNNKYVFDPQRGHLPHLWNIRVKNIKDTVCVKAKHSTVI